MGNRKDKKQKNKSSKNLSEKSKTEWQARYPILLFVGGFVLLLSLFYILWLSPWVNEHINPKITAINAKLSAKVLYLFGQGTEADGDSIFSPAYSINVAKGCDGIEAMAVFVLALLTFPMSWRKKIPGMFFGGLILFLLNIIRIVSLFLIGINYPSKLEVMHAEVWPAVFIIFAVGLWGAWVFHSTKINVKANA